MSESNAFGRSATVGSLQAGEAAIYYDKSTGQSGLAFCAAILDSDEEGGSDKIVAHSFQAKHPVLIFISPKYWKNLSAWVLPRSFQVELDFGSRISSRVLNSDRPWSYLFLDDKGRLLIPIYNPEIRAGEHRGWFSISDHRLLRTPGLYEHDFQCFTRWGLSLKQDDNRISIWKNDFDKQEGKGAA
tara:strand:- start:233 stop:790 length:558 start_codon:yes stop_codon:yes gene_type:complete